MITFKKIYCVETTTTGRVCNTYLGNLESGMRGRVHFPCRNHRNHRRENSHLSEWKQTRAGVVIYSRITEPVVYSDDQVRLPDA